MEKKQAVVVFSGGPDSTAAALWALENDFAPVLLTFQFKGKEQYGELYAAMTVADQLNLRHSIIDFKSPMSSFGDNVVILMHAATPRGDVATKQAHRMPFGAGMILSTASAWASYNGIPDLVWGATADDAFGGEYEYGEEFAAAIAALVSKSTGTEFSIHVPFSKVSKHRVLSAFSGRERLFGQTWSCKVSGQAQCGACAACVARRVAVAAAKLDDFTTYQTKAYMSPLTDKQIEEIDELPPDIRGPAFGSPR